MEDFKEFLPKNIIKGFIRGEKMEIKIDIYILWNISIV